MVNPSKVYSHSIDDAHHIADRSFVLIVRVCSAMEKPDAVWDRADPTLHLANGR
jgi:hypothetical protein